MIDTSTKVIYNFLMRNIMYYLYVMNMKVKLIYCKQYCVCKPIGSLSTWILIMVSLKQLY